MRWSAQLENAGAGVERRRERTIKPAVMPAMELELGHGREGSAGQALEHSEGPLDYIAVFCCKALSVTV